MVLKTNFPGFAVFGLFCCAALTAQTVVPSDDAHVNSALPAVNFGNSPFLEVGGTSRAFVRFDLSSLPAGTGTAVGSRVNLVLWVNRVGAAGSILVSEANAAWSESAINSNAQPSAGVSVGSISASAGNQFVYLDVTSSFQRWIATPSSNQGFILSGAGATDVFLDSKESVTTSHAPVLELIVAGPVGPTGATGSIGPIGATGATGPVGPVGAVGSTGAAGATGPAGPAGPVGATGAVGPVGAVGPTGSVGPIGPQGPTGAAGATGSAGAAGPAGATGAVGPPGPIGPQGPAGQAGLAGAAGSPGATGPPGPQGAAGPPTISTCSNDICVLNVAVNGSVRNQSHVSPGARFVVQFDWTSIGTGTYCPGCIQQFYVGISPEAVTGTASGVPTNCFISTLFNNQAQTSSANLTFVAPSTNGIYYLAVDSTLNFSCPSPPGGFPSGTPNPNQYIGAIIVY